ncbi:MAG: rRNA maturation RNAse YbeY, partial [Peptococcaceae bacterium]|nr:rRNA maturation RNAse YbeY [Peptococcaceae bacterium]
GLLHLAGYDHMEEEEKKEMRAREEELLAVIGAIR